MARRILWVGDAVVSTGFARVTHGIVDGLFAMGHQMGVLGLAYDGAPTKYPYPIWKSNHSFVNEKGKEQADTYGIRTLRTAIKEFVPDLVVLFHDPWVVAEMINEIQKLREPDKPKIVAYCPVDAEGLSDVWMSYLERADQVCVYTQFGAEQFKEAGFTGDLKVIPHGVDLSVFKRADKTRSRLLMGLPRDKWVVINTNRNQPRKRIDLTIKGFCQFAAQIKDRTPKPLLHLHMLPQDAGWDIIPLMRRECRHNGLEMGDVFSLTNFNKMPLKDAELNLLYNAADIGINTGLGEGWGLPAFEMAALGIPQIMTDYAAGKELFEGMAWMLPVVQKLTATGIGTEGGLTHEDHVAEALLDAYENPEKGFAFAQKAKVMVFQERFTWGAIARQVNEILNQVTSK